jgi:hypothetical protein
MGGIVLITPALAYFSSWREVDFVCGAFAAIGLTFELGIMVLMFRAFGQS